MPVVGDIVVGLGADRMIYRTSDKYVWYKRIRIWHPISTHHARNRRAKWTNMLHHIETWAYVVIRVGLPEGI